ncbi:MAG TPA: hypothetical protein VFW19_01400 [Allosphingosinicella sp.]|nr:hypothetical protein [Allosphingosinicella sp.]
MRKTLGLAGLVLLAACGRADQNMRQAADASANGGAPGVGPTAAPGVAFNYRYAFRLPAERIGAVQEEHAQACEKLGLAHCRITGMTFHRGSDEDVQAELDFRLDPTLARAFGKQGIEAVTHADGLLAEAEIKGEDQNGAIAAAGRDAAQQGDTLKKIETQLARPGLGAGERTQLQAQAQQAREALQASEATKAEREASLATTPMTFSYQAGDMAPGFRRSLSEGLGNVIGALEWMLFALITLAPWALLALLLWGLIRRFGPKKASQEA